MRDQNSKNSSVKQLVIDSLRKLHLMSAINSLFNVKYRLINAAYRLQGKSPLKAIYTNTFLDNENQGNILKNTPQIVAEFIEQNIKPASVIDFGCGTGIYLKELEKRGIEIFGLDGSASALKNSVIKPGLTKLADLTVDLDLDKRYSCAICFEVAEHIPTKFSDTLVGNIVKTSDIVLFSAAPKGQGGVGHINEQNPEFWQQLFKKRGLLVDQALTDKCRAYFKDQGAIFWLTGSATIYRNG